MNDHLVSIGLTFSGLVRIPMVKKSLFFQRLGELSFVYFYAFSDIGTVLYEKYYYGLSLSSFPALSSRKYFRTNLVSFMLVKVFELTSMQYRFNLFHPGWTTNGK